MSDSAARPRHDAKGDARGSVVSFPRRREPERRPENNLPVELSSFVGRQREVTEVKELLLAGRRPVTLTGPGGCGKSRLALAAAFEAVQSFEGGARWVGLAPLSDPELVSQAVASALGVREVPGRPLAQEIAKHLEPRKMLLILDNCEHLIASCALLTDALLRACPDLRILATSCEPLSVVGERARVVRSLSIPDSGHPPALRNWVATGPSACSSSGRPPFPVSSLQAGTRLRWRGCVVGWTGYRSP